MRNNALDAAKLLACFFIIVVHVGNYQEVAKPIGDFFRVSSRWALPFFFLSSGYLMGLSRNLDIEKKVNKLISILFYSSLLYIPILYRNFNWDIERLAGKIISNDTLHSGTFFHLWFINALILGVILTGYFIRNVNTWVSITVSVLIILACWSTDVIKSLHFDLYYFYTFRTLIAFSLVYIGYILAVTKKLEGISIKISSALIVAGIALMLAEVWANNTLFNADIGERQFPLFCVPVSIFLLALSVNVKVRDNIISKLGRDYSLGVYLIHPFILYHLGHDVGGVVGNSSFLKLFVSFASAIVILYVLKKFIPIVYNKLNGVYVK